jgi:hypothetical protein
MLAISQIHVFTIFALFPAFLHAPPVLASFDFSKAVAAQPPTIVAFLLFQVSSPLVSGRRPHADPATALDDPDAP